jgi:hypothetical protein
MTIKLHLIVGESNKIYLRFDNVFIDFTWRAKLIDVPGTM